jgi:pilus assembly protein CpaD
MRVPTGTAAASHAALIALLLGAVAGCVPLAPVPSAAVQPQPQAVPVTYAHTVRFGGGSVRPDATEAARLRAFAATLPLRGRAAVQLVTPMSQPAGVGADGATDRRRRAAVAEILSGLLPGDVPILTDAPEAVSFERLPGGGSGLPVGGPVEVLVHAHEVILPGCPDWSRDPAYDPRNLPLSNLGCANAVNLGLMLADPADLSPSGYLGAADGTREAEAIVRYRTDKVKQLKTDALEP